MYLRKIFTYNLHYNSKTICVTEESQMSFKIPNIPPTTNKSIRFPNDVIEQVEEAIRGRDCTFTAFVVAAVRAALESLKEEDGEQ